MAVEQNPARGARFGPPDHYGVARRVPHGGGEAQFREQARRPSAARRQSAA